LASGAGLPNGRDAQPGCSGGIIPLFLAPAMLLNYALQTRDRQREAPKPGSRRGASSLTFGLGG